LGIGLLFSIDNQLKTRQERREHFSRSIAVGSKEFIMSVQKALSVRAVGRRALETGEAGYQLKESITGYRNINSARTEIQSANYSLTLDLGRLKREAEMEIILSSKETGAPIVM
jgi:hypothetical protein